MRRQIPAPTLANVTQKDAGPDPGVGYADPARILRLIADIRGSGRYRRMAASGQARLDQLMPKLLKLATTLNGPDATFERVLQVVESIGRRESYLALLLEYPLALERLARLASASPWAAGYMAQHPVLLDELITPQSGPAPDLPHLRTALRASLDEHAGNTERQMDTLRHFKQTQTLRLLALDLPGSAAGNVSDHLSDLAARARGSAAAGLGPLNMPSLTTHFASGGYGKLVARNWYPIRTSTSSFSTTTRTKRALSYPGPQASPTFSPTTSAGVLYETTCGCGQRRGRLAGKAYRAFRDYQFKNSWIWEPRPRHARAVAEHAIAPFEAIRIVQRRPRD